MNELGSTNVPIVRIEGLERATAIQQAEILERWFRERFEDPANMTPYETAAGGYKWVWGGPYYPREVLEGEFEGVVPESVIDELSSKLEEELMEWAPIPDGPGFNDDYIVGVMATSTEQHSTFVESVRINRELLNENVNESVTRLLHNMLFVQMITTLETYLSDSFVTTLRSDESLLRRFIETTPYFKDEPKIKVAEIFNVREALPGIAIKYLGGLVWHKLDMVRNMYRATLSIEFSNNLGPLFRAIKDRHDIVHRNGRTITGSLISKTHDEVIALIEHVEALIEQIESQICGRVWYNCEVA